MSNIDYRTISLSDILNNMIERDMPKPVEVVEKEDPWFECIYEDADGKILHLTWCNDPKEIEEYKFNGYIVTDMTDCRDHINKGE